MILSRRVDDLILPATVTRIVALGDPHGDLAGLEVVLGGEERAGTAILSVGDNIGYADANACSELCRRLATRGIPSVFGNHEDWSSDDGELFLMKKPGGTKVLAADALAFCRARPMRIRITLEKEPGLVVSVVHTLAREVDGRIGWEYVTPVNADVLADEEGAQVVLCGHSHGPAIYEISPDGQVHTTHLSLEGDETASVTSSAGLALRDRLRVARADGLPQRARNVRAGDLRVRRSDREDRGDAGRGQGWGERVRNCTANRMGAKP